MRWVFVVAVGAVVLHSADLPAYANHGVKVCVAPETFIIEQACDLFKFEYQFSSLQWIEAWPISFTLEIPPSWSIVVWYIGDVAFDPAYVADGTGVDVTFTPMRNGFFILSPHGSAGAPATDRAVPNVLRLNVLPWWTPSTLSLSKTEVMPIDIVSDVTKSQSNVTFTVASRPPYIASEYIAMYVQKPEEGGADGGHDLNMHTNPPPVGRLNGRRVVFNMNTAVYRASEFGGEDEIVAAVSDDPFAASAMPLGTDAEQLAAVARLQEEVSERSEAREPGDKATAGQFRTLVKVKVPVLKKLPDPVSGVNNYIKIGGRAEHHGPPGFSEDNNHWGTPDVIDSLDSIASGVMTKIGLSSPLKYNDISLGDDANNEGYGGRFDINGNWKWSHGDHREGLDVDFRSFPPNSDGLHQGFEDDFELYVLQPVYPGPTVDVHGPVEHFHIDF